MKDKGVITFLVCIVLLWSAACIIAVLRPDETHPVPVVQPVHSEAFLGGRACDVCHTYGTVPENKPGAEPPYLKPDWEKWYKQTEGLHE